MSYGKSICKHLKAIRRQIAKENNISLVIPTCTYQGECAGTCPQCESEVRFLEKELAKRLSLGKAATVAGIAVTLSAPAAAQVNTIDTAANGHAISCPNNPSPHDYSRPTQGVIPAKTTVPDTVAQIAATQTIHGTIIDKKNNEPVLFANIFLIRNGKEVVGTTADLEGRFTLSNVMPHDQLRISMVGYAPLLTPISSSETYFLEIKPTEGLAIVETIIRSTLIDKEHNEPIPFGNIALIRNGEQVLAVKSDFDGNFTLNVPNLQANDIIEISVLGYPRKRMNANNLPHKILLTSYPGTAGEVIIKKSPSLFDNENRQIYERDNIIIKVK